MSHREPPYELAPAVGLGETDSEWGDGEQRCETPMKRVLLALTKVRAALLSFGCTVVVLVMLVVRGLADWSRSFAIAWYGVLIAATFFGVLGIGSAFRPRRTAIERRGLALALSLPAICTAALVVLFLFVIADQNLTD